MARPAGRSLGARPVARERIDIAWTVGAWCAVLVAMAGCAGSVSGDVTTTTRCAVETSPALTGTRVDLIDTLARLPSASPGEPDSLVRRLSTRESKIDAKGHFELARVPAGQYFVVAAGVGWKEVVVGRLGARVDLRIGRLLTPCGALGK